MTKSIFKSIAIGALIGLAIFMMPMFLIGIFIIVSLIRLVAGRGMHRGYHSFAYADNIRSMSEEEYTTSIKLKHKQPICIAITTTLQKNQPNNHI